MLFIEYDVHEDGEIELVALINAIEEDGQDSEGKAWLEWRRKHDDEGMGCVAVPVEDLATMEMTNDTDELRGIVERVILTDRAGKEAVS